MQKQKAYSVRELKGKEVHRELVLVHYFKPQMHICQYLLVIQHLWTRSILKFVTVSSLAFLVDSLQGPITH